MSLALMPTGGVTHPPAPPRPKDVSGSTLRDINIAMNPAGPTSPLFSPLPKNLRSK